MLGPGLKPFILQIIQNIDKYNLLYTLYIKFDAQMQRYSPECKPS